MEYTATRIRNMCKDVWPRLDSIWVTDRRYINITPQRIKEAATAIPGELRRVNMEKWDCEDIARNLVNEIHKKDFYNSEQYAAAIGTANGLYFQGELEPHMVCCFVYENKLWLFEPQTFEHWQPEPPKDYVFKIDF